MEEMLLKELNEILGTQKPKHKKILVLSGVSLVSNNDDTDALVLACNKLLELEDRKKKVSPKKSN